MKLTCISSFCLIISLANASTIPVAQSIPSNIQALYDAVKHGGCQNYIHNNKSLGDGEGHKGFGFCTDYEDQGFIYLAGPGELGDMDVDCDGLKSCSGDGDYQSGTAFDSTLSDGHYGISSLNAMIHSYTVLGTCHVAVDKPSGPIPPLSTVAVVCNNQLFYSVFGDTNGCDDADVTGEASYALANLCFPGQGLNGDKGYTGHDILYIAFTADDAVPGPDDANWKASNSQIFETSLAKFGAKLITGIKAKN